MNTYPIKVRERGQVTIPQSVREQFSARTGDILTLVQFDDFVLLAPSILKTPSLAKQFSQKMDDEGVSLADLLQGLAEEREASYNQTRSHEE